MNVPDAEARCTVRITDEPIGGEPSGMADAHCGALATFRGIVRARADGREVAAIDYECYREMAEKEMLSVANEAAARFELRSVFVAHRTGRVRAGETSVLVAVAAAHRGQAFDALRSIVDALKERAPIWKKEIYPDGTSRWL